MGNHQSGLSEVDAGEEQNVEVEGAGAVLEAGGAVAAEVLFDAEKGGQQGMRIEAGFQGYNRIDKARLGGKADRIGGVERRAANYAAQGFKARGRGGERRVGRSGMAGQVRAHSDVGRVHGLQSIAISHPLCKVRTMDGAQRVLFTLDLKVL